MNNLVEYQKQGSIGVITLNNPPVNALSVNKGLLQSLLDAFKEGDHDHHVRAFLVIGGGRNFSGGADISEFGKPYDPGKAKLTDVQAYMDTVTKPIVAAISGPTMGGGFELAMTCHYRIALTGAQIGLPEVKLGILPGAAGTQRAPRLMGVEKALDLMVSGDPVSSEQARDLGLVDEVVSGDLRSAAIAYTNKLLKDNQGVRRASQMTVQPPAEGFFESARARIGKTWRGYPAPLAILTCVEAAATQPFAKGCVIERQQFEILVKTDESRALRHLFFAERQVSKIPDVAEDTPVRDIKSAALIGAGTMGGGIAMNFANAGIPVTVVDMTQDALDKGLKKIKDNYAATVSKGRLTQEDMEKRVGLIRSSTSISDVANADIVIEAVFERMDVKQDLFKKLDAAAKPGAILATNTSTLDVDRIAAATKRAPDVIGTHFFSPANVMRLLEVVRGEKTAKDVLATTMKLGKRLKKVPVVSGVCDGFIGNRMLEKYGQQSLFLIDEGAAPQQVDRALQNWGMAMGPFAMYDMAGNDIGWEIRKRRYRERPDFVYSRVADRVCEQGRFGQKTGKGFYKYEAGNRRPIPDPEVELLIQNYRKEIGVKPRQISDEEIIERCIYALVNEGAYILEEGIALRASDIDMVYLTGYGFPPFRGGPMFYADTVGVGKLLASIERFQKGYQGSQWKPAPLLVKLAKESRRFND